MAPTLKERIEEIMAAKDMNVGQIATAAGVSSAAVSQWLGKGNGKTILTIGSVEAACNLEVKTGYRALWIATGKGQKLVDKCDAPLAPDLPQPDQFTRAIVHAFNALPNDPVVRGDAFIDVMAALKGGFWLTEVLGQGRAVLQELANVVQVSAVHDHARCVEPIARHGALKDIAQSRGLTCQASELVEFVSIVVAWTIAHGVHRQLATSSLVPRIWSFIHLDNSSIRGRRPPAQALRLTRALPSGDFGPVDRSHGFHCLINSD